mmetsp:Transcript_102592/g.289883  ORF Transcript_102592/g.289883 Transcript_102592/m.289883 type:complete len:238 (-) Transcript_102592:451-1164(-)
MPCNMAASGLWGSAGARNASTTGATTRVRTAASTAGSKAPWRRSTLATCIAVPRASAGMQFGSRSHTPTCRESSARTVPGQRRKLREFFGAPAPLNHTSPTPSPLSSRLRRTPQARKSDCPSSSQASRAARTVGASGRSPSPRISSNSSSALAASPLAADRRIAKLNAATISSPLARTLAVASASSADCTAAASGGRGGEGCCRGCRASPFWAGAGVGSVVAGTAPLERSLSTAGAR